MSFIASRMSENKYILTLKRLVKRHKRVRITFLDGEELCGCRCRKCHIRDIEENGPRDYRRRILSDDGNCIVQYKSNGYTKYSKYEECCFLEGYDLDQDNYDVYGDYESTQRRKYSVAETIDLMLDHDKRKGDINPILIEYGKRFSKKLKVKVNIKWE